MGEVDTNSAYNLSEVALGVFENVTMSMSSGKEMAMVFSDGLKRVLSVWIPFSCFLLGVFILLGYSFMQHNVRVRK